MLPSPLTLDILTKVTWETVAASHFQAARKLTAGARERRSAGLPHPVEDFIFQYYPYPISLLEDWQPAFGIGLEFHDFESLPPRFHARRYRTADSLCYLDATQLEEKERSRLAWIKSLLEATQRNVPHFACHGLHEWAMVYQAENIRHATLAPLRLPQDQIDSLVNSRAITCSHHDAFRFFAKKAQPFNRLQPTLETRHQNEQPGCIHANMDLYKWAAKSMPWIGSELFLEIFRLATQLRSLDMRASPYDLSEWDLVPVKIETPEGRKAYETEQRRLAAHAFSLREKLIIALENTLRSQPLPAQLLPESLVK